MKQKKTSRLLASVLAIAMGATMTSGLFTAQAQEEIGENTIIHAFKNIDVDSKPMARFWFPDAGAGADADDLISEQIEAMAKGGFGGVEIAMIADETTYTNQQAKEYGWGTENWVNVLKKTLRAANAIEGGFKVDITITSHWPPVINTIDPNETTASTELSYQYTKITQDDLNNGTKDLAMPEQKTTDSRNGYFLTVDRFTDASAIQVESVDADGNLTFDFDSITSLKDSVSVKEGAGYAAGIPDEAKAEEMAGGDKTQKQAILDNIYEAFGDVPTEEIPDGEKFDSQGNRKRMADWQDIYQADLSGLKDQLGALDNDMEIKAGDWVLFGVFERGTGQVLSGGGINTMYGRTYATDYFSTEGIQEVIDYWNEHFLSDPELVSLLKENGSSIFEDSIEASHTGPFWTHNMLNELDEGYAYADEFATVVAVNSAKSSGGGFPGGPGGGGNTTPPIQFNNDVTSRIVEDYNLKLGELYESDHASVISEWAKTFHYNYRAQGYTLTGLDIAGAAAALDIPEGDNATSGDGLRNLSAAVNMYDKQYLSMEAITTIKIASTWETIAGILNSNFSHGVNRVILHGTPYAKTFDNNHTAWPGWGWGGGGAGVGEFTAWNQRQIYWEDVNTIADFMSRNQALLQNGTAKVDVALLNDTSSSFSILSGNCMQGLLDNGYSYNILSEALLKSENANVTNGVLYEDGPSYKAVILNEANVLSVDTLEKLNQYADAGLPIILYNCSPSQVYGTETADNNDETLVQLVDQLKQHEKVASVSSEEELLTILDQLQVSSAASYQASGIETSHRTDSTNSDYYYIFNSTEETQTTTMTLEGQGTPYIMDSWTGEITPIAHYTQTEDTITCDVTLEPQESTIIAIAPDQEEFGSSQDVHVEEANGTVVYDGNDIVYRSNTVGTDMVKFSDGTTKEITIDETMAEIDLSGEGWNLQLDSYGPDDSPENLDENGELIDPTAHKITTLNYANIALIPWTSLDVSEDDLKALSTSLNEVTSMRDVSGIGYYTKTFTLPEDWDSSKGAVVTFAHDEDMVTKVTVNDTTIDKIDSINEVVDIGNYLKPGENTIQIKLDTTVKNRISLETGYVDSPWVTESRDTDYGLTSVVLKPYTEVVLSADMPEETADKGILNSVIKYAENAKASGEYDNAIESVQKSFDAALENAKTVAANYSATQEDVDAAWKTLLNEIHKLGFVAGNKTELASLIAAAEKIDLSKYVEAGQIEFTAALETAQTVYKNGDAMQSEINEVSDNLLNAMLNLRFKADKSVLEDVLAQANKIDASAYTSESYAILTAAVKDAKAVLENENATQEEVDAEVANVRAAIEDLISVENTTETSSTDNNTIQTGQESTTTKANTAKTGDFVPIAGLAAITLAGAALLLTCKKK